MYDKKNMKNEAIFYKKRAPHNPKKINGHYVENLPINSKLLILEDESYQENDFVVVGINVFTIAQVIIKKHPLRKTFEAKEFTLRWVGVVNQMKKVQEIIAKVE
ncbi:hypothetical protein NPX79_02010 [Spiroplasma endosymbiont of Anurida maritima]|uniref:hypothetical protein n=1 Tax=Spiroplasma endosymbiont of Anurida maritima TaxID=2967972 RepID=UPI0036D39036